MYVKRATLISIIASVPGLAGGLPVLKAAPDDTLGARATTAPFTLLGGSAPGRFELVNTNTGKSVRHISLRGMWDFDAISPDGKRLYFIQHGIGGNPNHYAVRLYWTATGRLAAGRIADKREIEAPMTGVAVSRTMGPGNRWAYTLYRRTNGEMFVHALDTPNSLAVCIDLPKKVAARGTLHLSANLDGDQLRIVNGRGAQVARVAVQPNFGGYGGFHIVN